MIFTLEYLFLLKWCFYAYILIEEMLKLGYTSCHCKYYSEQGPIFKLCEYLVLSRFHAKCRTTSWKQYFESQ